MHGGTIDTNSFLKYLLISVLLCFLLYFGKALFVPLFYGLFIAIVLYPFCHWLEKHHVPKTLAITAGLLIVLILFGLLVWLVLLQFNAFRHDLPELNKKVGPSLSQFQQWLWLNFNITVAAQNDWWENSLSKISDISAGFLAGTFNRTVAALFSIFIIPIFAALFLYNRQDFILFLEKLAGERYQDKIHSILHQTLHTYSSFIKGMVLVYIIVGMLNSIGLLALGINHAILFGFLTAVMTIIPYFGIFISALLPITIAWITKDSIWYPLAVVAIFAFVQYLEANVIFPKVVATQLNLSTWATLVAIIAGGILWGVSGMILFIPFVGILKMVSDYIPEWEALNILLRRTASKKS